MKYLSLLSRILLGSVFIFSGFVKAIDPLGSAYKFSDYFSAFGMGFLEGVALPLAIFLSSFELVLGIILILGYRRRTVYTILLWFLSFFTLITLVLALFNPVTDCGCFGDALILSNWQTFLKNVVLMAFALFLFFRRKQLVDEGKPMTEWSIAVILLVGVSLFSTWNYLHLPLMDFRPYDVGTIIEDEMGIPEGAPVDEYETTLIYRNRDSGKSESFTIADYPRDTVEWDFVSSESRLVRKGYEPPIHDFAIMDENGFDVAGEILADREYSLLMICYDLSKTAKSALLKARDWSQLEILANDFRFYAVTASPSEEVASISSSLGLGYGFLSGDEIMLKTIIRSNPGFVLLKNGMVIGKWGYRDFPSVAEMDPGLTEIIGNASAPLDEEAQLLMEEGLYDDFSFGVLDFERFTSGLIYEPASRNGERNVVVLFVLGLVILLFLSGFIAPIRV